MIPDQILVGQLSQQGSTKKTVTSGAATTFATITVPTGLTTQFVGGMIRYCAVASDGTDFQMRSGIIPFSVVRKGAALTMTIGTPGAQSEIVAVSAGTLTISITEVDAGSGVLQLKATVTSSLTTTLCQFNYVIEVIYPDYPVTILAQ